MAKRSIIAALALCTFPLTIQAAQLTVGSPAPKLEVSEWLRGGPIDLAAGQGKNVYVVEFWATWCGPCMQSIGHLNHLQEVYGSKNVVFLGVTDESPAVVGKFLKSSPFGQKITYNIACDQKGDQIGKTFMNYMVAAQQHGIPTAFIVDRQGMVAWIGSPFLMEAALAQILSLQFDSNRTDNQVSADLRYLRRHLPALQKAANNGDWETAISLSEEIAFGNQNCSVELRCQVLCNLVQDIMNNDAARATFGKTAMYIAREACNICDSQDPNVLDCHAYTLYMNGQIDDAVAELEKAVKLTPEGQLKAQRATQLAEYTKAKPNG